MAAGCTSVVCSDGLEVGFHVGAILSHCGLSNHHYSIVGLCGVDSTSAAIIGSAAVVEVTSACDCARLGRLKAISGTRCAEVIEEGLVGNSICTEDGQRDTEVSHCLEDCSTIGSVGHHDN